VIYGQRLVSDVCDEHLPMGRPQGPYGRAKQEQERIAESLEASHGLRVTTIRPSNVYGPGSVPWVDKVIEQLRSGRPTLVGDGRRDAALTYVDNVVDVFVRAAERPGAIGRVYNANDEAAVSWRRYFSDLAAMIGAPAPRSMPQGVASAAAYTADAAYRLLRRSDRAPITREAFNLTRANLRVPIARARRELGYEPTVSYDQAMLRIRAYLAERGLLARAS
jgi:2-alkyl-3-oxoalkanoate reductase